MGSNQTNHHLKPITVNSIKNSSVKKILKPCEARAGHGFIAIIVGLAFISVIITLAIKLIKWMIN